MELNSLIIGLIILVMLVGIFLIVQMIRSKTYQGDEKSLEYKNDLPILPRSERNFQDNQVPFDDLVSSEPIQESDPLSHLAKVASQPPVEPLTKSMDKAQNPDYRSMPFEQNSPMLDRHLKQELHYESVNDPLLNAKDAVTLVITPRNQAVGVSGKEVLHIAKVYGLKFGLLSMYHRYENEDGSGDLWFSMLGVGRDGVMQTFDVNTMADSRFVSLSLFLSLPNPQAHRGFSGMVTIGRMIAKDLDADLHDEDGYIFDDAYIEQLRLKVVNYQA